MYDNIDTYKKNLKKLKEVDRQLWKKQKIDSWSFYTFNPHIHYIYELYRSYDYFQQESKQREEDSVKVYMTHFKEILDDFCEFENLNFSDIRIPFDIKFRRFLNCKFDYSEFEKAYEVFDEHKIEDCIFYRCILRDTFFKEIIFKDCVFEKCDLSISEMEKCVFENCTFKECEMEDMSLIDCNFKEGSIIESYLFYIDVSGSSFEKLNFINNNFRYEDFSFHKLRNANLIFKNKDDEDLFNYMTQAWRRNSLTRNS